MFPATVQSDGMNKLGLTTGTIVSFRSTAEPENNVIGAARLGDEVTLKRFVMEDERTVRLQPESTKKRHKPRKVNLEKEDFSVAGVYVGTHFGGVQPRTRTGLTQNEVGTEIPKTACTTWVPIC